RTDVHRRGGRNDEYRVEGRIEVTIGERDRPLVGKLPGRANTADHGDGAPPRDIVGEQPVELVHLDGRQRCRQVAQQGQPLVDAEQGLLRTIVQDGDDHAIEQPDGAFDEVDVPQGGRI